MELLDIAVLAGVASIPVGLLVGMNIGTYRHTREWLENHKIGLSVDKQYENFKGESMRGYLVYYLGFPGRSIAYRFHSKK